MNFIRIPEVTSPINRRKVHLILSHLQEQALKNNLISLTHLVDAYTIFLIFVSMNNYSLSNLLK